LTWRARLSVGVPLGLLFIGAIAALDIWLLNRLVNQGIRTQQIGLGLFLMGTVVLLSIPALLILAYQTLSCLTLRYHVDRNGVVVRWAGTKQIIPIRSIQQVVSGEKLGKKVVQRRGLRWPGHVRGEGMVPGIGLTRFLSTRPLTGQLLLVTPGMAFGISPNDLETFRQAFEARQDLGPNRLLQQELIPAGWSTWRIWTDQTAWALLGAAVLVNLGLFGFLAIRFPNLDIQLPLHFNSLGQPDRIGTKMELFTLPIIGLIILGTNLVLGLALYKRERAGSYLLWGSAATVQALFWLAAFSIVP
jgi:hypothetical protein